MKNNSCVRTDQGAMIMLAARAIEPLICTVSTKLCTRQPRVPSVYDVGQVRHAEFKLAAGGQLHQAEDSIVIPCCLLHAAGMLGNSVIAHVSHWVFPTNLS
jgi:hypothetical protein